MKIDFREVKRPTLVKAADGTDMPAAGTFWIEPRAGQVLRVAFDCGASSETRLTVDYRQHPVLGLTLPIQMTEKALHATDKWVEGKCEDLELPALRNAGTDPHREAAGGAVAATAGRRGASPTPRRKPPLREEALRFTDTLCDGLVWLYRYGYDRHIVTKAGIAELKNNLSRYINVVRGGGEVVVLDRDTPVARIVPFDRRAAGLPAAQRGTIAPDDERLAELERQGVIRRGDAGAVRDWQKARSPSAWVRVAAASSRRF